MTLIERLLREAGQNKADLVHLRESLAELRTKLDEAEARIATLNDLVEQARGGWRSVTTAAGVLSAIVGAAVALYNWFRSTKG